MLVSPAKPMRRSQIWSWFEPRERVGPLLIQPASEPHARTSPNQVIAALRVRVLVLEVAFEDTARRLSWYAKGGTQGPPRLRVEYQELERAVDQAQRDLALAQISKAPPPVRHLGRGFRSRASSTPPLGAGMLAKVWAWLSPGAVAGAGRQEKETS